MKAGRPLELGRPMDPRRAKYAKRFGLTQEGIYLWRRLPTHLLEKLDGCKDDSARRVLLGIGRPR